VIGGRILDTSALLAFAHGTSIYASAAVWTAVEEPIVLIAHPDLCTRYQQTGVDLEPLP
jgi:hypothetical protein